MKRLISCLLVFLLIMGAGPVSADDYRIVEYKDAEYTLEPWTFWQTGVISDGWNPWMLSAFKYVYIPNDSDKYSDSTPDKPNYHSRIYGYYEGKPYLDEGTVYNDHLFNHESIGHHPKDDSREVTVDYVSHGYIANIEDNGWSSKWISTPTESESYPPYHTTEPQETTSFIPYLMDNDPYTLRSWTTVSGLKKSETYACQFEAYIDDDAMMRNTDDDINYSGQIESDNKYCKIIGTSPAGKVLFIRYIDIPKNKTSFTFDFDTNGFDQVKVEMQYGAFLMTGPIIKHKEVNWSGTVHVEDFRIVKRRVTIIETSEDETSAIESSGEGDITTINNTTEAPIITTYQDATQATPTSASKKEETVKNTTNVESTSKGLKKFKFSSAKSKKKKSLKLKWQKIKGIDGYQITYGRDKNFDWATTRIFKRNKTSVTIKGLKSKKKVYVRGRTFVKENGTRKFGPWSKPKKVKIK